MTPPRVIFSIYPFISPILEYEFVVWSSYTIAIDIHRIDHVQNCLINFISLGLNITYPNHDYRPISQTLKFNFLSTWRDKFGKNQFYMRVELMPRGFLNYLLDIHTPSNTCLQCCFYPLTINLASFEA
ncbi:Uncharacterized protein FWK35_00009087 [Aphis craccivora]|uniref:Uncharacterized protein n=1 Tax=Aphis craccivora TaxID=307492 RepID=A0A6G0ZHC4_APHCR|nr:Uncharacterized protein FWK35_00009087 [Aphis craccivora]